MKIQTAVSAVLLAILAVFAGGSAYRPVAQAASASAAPESLDYEYFKTHVEPIFLKERPGHARCYTCHGVLSGGVTNIPASAFRLEKLSPGNAFWTEDQSRVNFQNVSQLVVAGDPAASRLLMHPLAPEAGGDYHFGGRQFASQQDPDWQTIDRWIRGQTGGGNSGAPGAFFVYVADFSGNTVDVIDPTTNKVVQTIEGIELPHGVAFSPDAKRVYITSESDRALVVLDQQTGNILKKVRLSGYPNNLAVSKDGGRVFVAISEAPGDLDIVDTVTLEKVKSIPMKGTLHNVYVTPDGKYVVMGSPKGKFLAVVDARTEQLAWEINFDRGVQTMAFETAPDGSTRRIFVTTPDLHGFRVVDFAEQKIVDEIKLPDEPSGGKFPSAHVFVHGIGITPDKKTLWINSRKSDVVFVFSLPDLKLLGHVVTGVSPEWITFSPDSSMVYDSNRGGNSVSVIDARSLKEVARIPVGQTPARNGTLVLPTHLASVQ